MRIDFSGILDYNVYMEIDIIKNEICLKDKKQAKYLQLVKQLEQLIVSGKLQVGEKIPGERKLARQLGVSVITITKAMTELMNRRIVERRVGSGTYVCQLNSRGRATSRIGFFCHHNFNAHGQFVNNIVVNLLEFWSERNVDLLVLAREARDYESTIKAYNLDGIMVYSPRKEFVPAIKRLIKREFPVVALSSIQQGLESISFGYSNEAIMDAAVSYLSKLKHQNIALLLPDWNEAAYKNRLEGFQQAMWKYKLPVNPHWIRPMPKEEAALCKMLEESSRPNAVIIGANEYVEPFYLAAAKLNFKIPGDISVLSIDENTHFQTMPTPPSSFRIDARSLTFEGAEAMVQILAGKGVKRSSQKNFEFIDRKSCINYSI